MKTANIETVRKAAKKAKGEETGPFIVKLWDIRHEPEFQIRSGLDPAWVNRLAGAYKSGTDMTPIVIAFCDEGMGPAIVDGHHRFAAREVMKADTINAIAIAIPRSEAIARAAQANNKHGKPLTRSERLQMFRKYIQTRQHVRKAGFDEKGQNLAGTFKSYSDLAGELGIPKPTIYGWMKKYFKPTFAKMAKEDGLGGTGGTRPATREYVSPSFAAAQATLGRLEQSFADAESYWTRSEIISALEETLDALTERHKAEDEKSGYWGEYIETAEDDESAF